MVDPRITKLARLLVDYSIKVDKGDTIRINCGVEAKELALELHKLLLKKGAYSRINVGLPGFVYTYYKYATEEQLRHFPKISMYETRNTAGSINIISDSNTRELTNVDPKKIAVRKKTIYPLMGAQERKNNWVLCLFPTNALAQEADMSLEEYRDFVFNACLIDWESESRKQDKIKKVLDDGSKVRIIGKDTDITFSIKGRQAIKCDGHRNMPDGEVFIAPVENTTEGYIAYSYPALYAGQEVDGIKLEFKKGKVIKAGAEKNEDLLKALIDTDKGSRFLGELGIGLNPGIKRFTKEILFDEKINGTVHLALGNAYKEGGGRNKSALHWDMIKDLRKEGELLVDDVEILKNGKL